MSDTDPASCDFAPRPGQSLHLSDQLRLVLAPNPSPMTERGTNSYLLGKGAVCVIDPGPASRVHLTAILAALEPGERITQILVTHTHNDHSPGARALADATGAPVFAFGTAFAGRSTRMQALAGANLGGGEGIDTTFAPDETLANGATLEVAGQPLIAVHTPGHLGNHLCFQWREALFTGDHVMGWAPSLVSPPDGDLTDFMASLERIESLGKLCYYPGHGAPITEGAQRVRALRAHRQARETAIRTAVAEGAATIRAITDRVYTDVPLALIPAAARNVLAHLIDLEGRGLLKFDGKPSPLTPIKHL